MFVIFMFIDSEFVLLCYYLRNYESERGKKRYLETEEGSRGELGGRDGEECA